MKKASELVTNLFIELYLDGELLKCRVFAKSLDKFFRARGLSIWILESKCFAGCIFFEEFLPWERNL